MSFLELRRKRGLVPQLRRELAEYRVKREIAEKLEAVDDRWKIKDLRIDPFGYLESVTLQMGQRHARIGEDGRVHLTAGEFERTYRFRSGKLRVY